MNQGLLTGEKTAAVQKLLEALQQKKTTAVYDLPESQATYLAALITRITGKRVLLVLPNDLAANKATEDAQQLVGNASACLPSGEIELGRGVSSHENTWRRLETLQKVVSGETKLLCVSMDAMLRRMASPDQFKQALLRLAPGDRIMPDQLMSQLLRMGYERVEMVEGKGQCALRGSIVDCYPPAGSVALRLEFFDDEVDSIRTFDCISQRSQEKLKNCMLSPATEIVLAENDAPAAADRLRQAVSTLGQGAPKENALFDNLPPLPEDDEELPSFFDQEISPRVQSAQLAADVERRTSQLLSEADLLESGIPFKRMAAWLPILLPQTCSVIDWYDAPYVFMVQPDQLRQRCDERRAGFAEDLQNAMERGDAVPAQEQLLMTYDEVLATLQGHSLVVLSEFLRGMGGIQPEVMIQLGSRGVAGYQGQVKALAADCEKWRREGNCVVLLSGGVARGKRLTDALTELGTPVTFCEELSSNLILGEVLVLPMTLSKGFLWPDAKLAIVSDTDLYGAGYRRTKTRKTSGERIATFTDLKVGDYVVHEDHGVGIYQGTIRLQSEGTYRDYLAIQYQGADKLYVPIEQLDRVQRYIGNPNALPKLNRLGGGEWQKQKSKVKAGLKELAFDLVKLYASREQHKGHAFGADTTWQKQFEDQFPYELTPDQEQSVREITRDMESDRNMDRLLCGDVGYGKTEVSLRAAFKAVMDGKQVALLAPTTILAQQHFNTIKRRFEHFPVECEVLSRFRTAKEQKDILKRLSEGKIDILVGTHRLLAKDVHFKDLGLLIVDEEQRFGVAHKEIIKNMKNEMDVLTLSATPIPRTLHMSMVGIRDMSVLETPPEERLPVQTHVVEYSDAVIRDAILRELSRGGQVYFLYNRVHSIEQFYTRLRALVPEARIGIAHGQMKEHGLEDVMMDFYSGNYDVLLCTTIIESGLDVPSANTLIVFDADRFGLSQLYQLRGRVGRSNRQAYAYFTVRPDKMLSEEAEQRLSAIREFTEFGAGFRIAMRDLEIRGAGNLLGPEQHGHLATVGYDMYCKLMEETLHEVQGQQLVAPELATRVDLKVDAYLPSDYVHDERQRMEMYKRISSLRTDIDREDIEEEMIDRYGDLPAPVETLLDIAQMRALAQRLGVSQVLYRPKGQLMMRLDQRYMPDLQLMMQAMVDTDSRLSITPSQPVSMVLKDPTHLESGMLTEGLKVLKQLVAHLDQLLAAQTPEAKQKA